MAKQERREKREQARQARVEAQRRRARARRRKKFLISGAVVLVVAAVAGFSIFRSVTSRARFREAAAAAGCSPIEEIEDKGAQHVQADPGPESYNSTPATSGPHGPLAEWGSQPELLAPYQYVHNMEHGGVVIQYQGLSDAEIEELEDNVDSYREGVIAMPNDELDTALAMGAWARLQTCEKFSIPAVESFIGLRCGKGPEKINSCPKS